MQLFERECGFQRGDVSGDTDKLKEYTVDANLALDDFTKLAIKSSGTWQFDDSNQSDYPIITTDLVANQRDYSFTTDGNGNYILEVLKVLVADSSGVFRELTAVDSQSSSDTKGYWDGQNTTGTPLTYDKTANSIFLDPIPSYSYAGGLKVYISREPSYFIYTDTSRVAGVPGIFHKYLALKPAQDYARRNNLANQDRIREEVLLLENEIEKYFALRPRDQRRRLTTTHTNNK